MTSSGNEGEEDGDDKEGEIKSPCFLDHRISDLPEPNNVLNKPLRFFCDYQSRHLMVRFRSVCKSCCTIIYEPQFVKKHLSLANKDDYINHWRVITCYKYHDLKPCSLNSIFHEPFGYAVDLYYPFMTLQRGDGIVGSCNGLIPLLMQMLGGFQCWNKGVRACACTATQWEEKLDNCARVEERLQL